MADKAINCSISLYKTQIDKIRKYKNNNKNFNSDASVFQHIINSFFEDENERIKTYIILHVVYPAILCGMAWYGFNSTGKLIGILLEQNMVFAELNILNRIFSILSFLTLGILGASFYLLRNKITDKVFNR